MSKIRSAGFVIFRQLKQNPIEYLLLQTQITGGHWTPPKGHIEPGETLREAAERETKEEAGLDKNDFEYYDNFQEIITYNVKERPKDTYYFLGCIRNPQQNIKISDEHEHFIWANLQDSCNLIKREEIKSVLRKAEQFILNYKKE